MISGILSMLLGETVFFVSTPLVVTSFPPVSTPFTVIPRVVEKTARIG
jgi:hypothetical protein